MWLFYFLFWTAVRASKEPLYGKIGDEVVLTPASVVNPITSIEWKHGSDIAMDWYKGKTTSYRHFRERGSLNTSNGALTITGLTPDDSGSYTVEINSILTSKTELLVISPVSKPNLSIRCEPEKTYCVLTCNGNTTDAEPVTYRWTSSDDTWSSTKEHNITKEDSELWFSCAFENPVSFNSSEKVLNPFIKSDRTRIIIIISVFILVVCIIIILIIYFIRKRKTREAVDGTQDEMSKMLLADQKTSTQDPTSVVTHNTSNGTERPASLVAVQETSTQDPTSVVTQDTSNETERPASPVAVQETSNQDTTSTVPPETSNETERSTTCPEVPETSTQDQETAESPDPNNETETLEMLPPVEDTSTQDPTSVVTPDTSNETVNSTISDVHETSTQDQETAESPDPSNETERPASPVAVQETSNQDTTSTVPPETSNETERSTTSPEVPETSTQDLETAESPDPSNETGTKPQWQFEGDSGAWYEFICKRGTTKCSVNSDEIERKFQQNPNSKMPFTVNRNYYELNFEAKVQINLMTKTRRKVRRVLL